MCEEKVCVQLWRVKILPERVNTWTGTDRLVHVAQHKCRGPQEDTGWKQETNIVDTMWLKVVIFIMANTLAIVKEQENKSNNLAFK